MSRIRPYVSAKLLGGVASRRTTGYRAAFPREGMSQMEPLADGGPSVNRPSESA
jgi:hypothetical protein